LIIDIDKNAQQSPDFWLATAEYQLIEWQGIILENRGSNK
jgi:hypothetical protein